ncbi:MAG: hypothetical protein ABW019_18465 [Chitinophagaceae bacterium]
MRKNSFLLPVSLLATTLFLTACIKQDAENKPESLDSQLVTGKVHAWLDSKTSTNAPRNERVRIIRENLDFPQLFTEELNEKEKLIVIPIKSGFVANTNKADRPVNYLVLVMDEGGNINKGNLVQYIPETKQAGTAIPHHAFSQLYNAEDVATDGRFAMLSIFDRLLFEAGYKGGQRVSFAQIRPKDKQRHTAAKEPEICIDWYLVTTYYYLDGTREVREEYLFTTCSGGGCQPNELCDEFEGGTGGANFVDYQYDVGETVDWTVFTNPVSGIGEVKSRERLKGRRVSTEPQGGHFTGIYHYWSYCNFCYDQHDVWLEQVNRISAAGQTATSYIFGRLQYKGTVSYPSNTTSWSFAEVNW